MSIINYFDPRVFQSFRSGNTDGILNFDNQTQKEYLKDFQPSNISDLAILYAMDRPIVNEKIPHLIKRKKGIETVLYHHPMLIPFFEYSYGIPVFQEQWMEFAREIAGLSIRKTKKLNMAMGKKHLVILNDLKIDFTNGLRSNSMFMDELDNSVESIEKIWNEWLNSAPYLFKKPFAYINAIVAYREMAKKIME